MRWYGCGAQDTHAALGSAGRARAQPATVVLFLAKQSATDITLFVTVDPATHVRGVITAARCGPRFHMPPCQAVC